MPITFDIDLTQRRRRQETLDQLQRLQEGLVGARSEGPPTRFGEVPVEGGLLPPSPQSQFVSQLLGSPTTASSGITAALNLLEQQRQQELEQQQLAQQQQVLSGITEERPGLASLAQLTELPGFQKTAIPAFTKALAPEGTDTVDPVQSSRQLPGGGVQIVRRSGAVDLVSPSQENAELIRSAEVRGAELQGLRAGQRGAASESIKASVEAFKGLKTARDNIAFMDEGIRLLDEGAATGAVEGRLPSVKEASVRLDNLQARMGLNVIQNTTFGSLSESELAFALSTALPQGLDGPALRKWMQEKRNAQDKLAKYLEEAAIFLGTPGNTIAEFMRLKRQRGQIVQPSSGMSPIQRPPLSSFGSP